MATLGAASAELAAGTAVRAPMACSRGPSDQAFVATVTLPRTAAQASIYSVRIDGVPSGKISHFGLNHIKNMATDYVLPAGATYVPGSARIVPGTGTANVLAGARVTYEAGMIRVVLPGRVPSGSAYTPPSIEFQLQASAPAGAALPIEFSGYRVTANAFLVGDVQTICEPIPKLYAIGTTLVTAPSP
jgi:hypothetical protein